MRTLDPRATFELHHAQYELGIVHGEPIPDDADRNTSIDNAGAATTGDWAFALVAALSVVFACGQLAFWLAGRVQP